MSCRTLPAIPRTRGGKKTTQKRQKRKTSKNIGTRARFPTTCSKKKTSGWMFLPFFSPASGKPARPLHDMLLQMETDTLTCMDRGFRTGSIIADNASLQSAFPSSGYGKV